MIGALYSLVSSNFFWGYILPAYVVYLGVNNKDEVISKDGYDKGMKRREWIFVLLPYVNFFGAILIIGALIIKGVFWLFGGFMDDKRNR